MLKALEYFSTMLQFIPWVLNFIDPVPDSFEKSQVCLLLDHLNLIAFYFPDDIGVRLTHIENSIKQ